VRDRLSFRRFCGLPLEAETPDHASIWRFRQTIDKLGLSAALLLETNRQLDGLGLVVKRGTLADATLIEAAVKRPAYGSGGVNPRDPDARVTMKRKTVHLGYSWQYRLQATGQQAQPTQRQRVETPQLSRDSWHGQRIGDGLAVEIDDGVMDG
jgi:IS5 family transposase